MNRMGRSNAPWPGDIALDLTGVTAVLRPTSRASLDGLRPGDALLGGGTWLFSEPQPAVRRLVDLDALGWEPLRVSDQGLHIAATCTVAHLAAAALPWEAACLVRPCCEALLGSFKVWAMATVGGNLCLALPAGPMTRWPWHWTGAARSGLRTAESAPWLRPTSSPGLKKPCCAAGRSCVRSTCQRPPCNAGP